MKYIDITTSHNISVRYELATTLLRILAWSIDMMILSTYATIVGILVGGNTVLFYVFIFIVVAFYHLFFEMVFNGQSPGKMALKLKVVTLKGRTAKPQDYFLRWIFRIIEITFTAGALAILFISSSDKYQRIGDMLAQTTVVKLRPETVFNLQTLLALGKQKRKIKYPKVVMYSDQDMMLLKDTLSRVKLSPTDNNRRFLVQLASRISNELDIKLDRKNRANFLEEILLDYISLTR
ncbi:MAG: RDD family protein [Saprospiraceae bacterium]